MAIYRPPALPGWPITAWRPCEERLILVHTKDNLLTSMHAMYLWLAWVTMVPKVRCKFQKVLTIKAIPNSSDSSDSSARRASTKSRAHCTAGVCGKKKRRPAKTLDGSPPWGSVQPAEIALRCGSIIVGSGPEPLALERESRGPGGRIQSWI